ncbi:MAG: TetR/AcrR family transcriptional regulator [Deltaproteobacteria bacterium]|nr:TetR/AcrR family transcriptional regulator [Deltaproteobacteria bacterium]
MNGEEGMNPILSITDLQEGMKSLSGRSSELSAKRELTRQKIVSTATEVFCSRGFRRATLEEIAEISGLSRGTLYTYAKTKERLLLMAIAEESLLHLDDYAVLYAPQISERERLIQMVALGVTGFEERPLTSMVVRGELKLMDLLKTEESVAAAFPKFDKEAMLKQCIQEATERTLSKTEISEALEVIHVFGATGPQLLDTMKVLGLDPVVVSRRLATLVVNGLNNQAPKKA